MTERCSFMFKYGGGQCRNKRRDSGSPLCSAHIAALQRAKAKRLNALRERRRLRFIDDRLYVMGF